MPKLLVVPHDVIRMMNDEGIPLSTLGDIDRMSDALSAHDMAEIHLAHKAFPFEFDQSLQITPAQSPLVALADIKMHDGLYHRVNERIQTLKLQEESSAERFTPAYMLNPVDETLWVAVLQRQDSPEGDPYRALLSANRAFFDALMAQALHLHPFERVCSTNLFTYYVGSLPAKAA